jgi:integrase/recombinase XerD
MPDVEYLEKEQALKLENAALNLRDKLLIRIPRVTGCRISEDLGIGVEDIDFKGGRLKIQHLKSRINLACPDCGARLGKKHTFCPKCGARVESAVAKEVEHKRMRTIPLDKETLTMLRSYIDHGGPVMVKGRKVLFNINRIRAWQIFRDCAVRAHLPHIVNPETGRVHGVSPHKLRDAFAINAVKKNDSSDGIRMLQEQLGHQNIGTTMKYRKVAGQELNEWYQDIMGETPEKKK